ncbi:hypothetical protein DFH09DRAFT_1301033 [Mycena vulgaris]|nr:hypothetical protein DFH09DRAFT_1301033 [Mycena vulgaris]
MTRRIPDASAVSTIPARRLLPRPAREDAASETRAPPPTPVQCCAGATSASPTFRAQLSSLQPDAPRADASVVSSPPPTDEAGAPVGPLRLHATPAHAERPNKDAHLQHHAVRNALCMPRALTTSLCTHGRRACGPAARPRPHPHPRQRSLHTGAPPARSHIRRLRWRPRIRPRRSSLTRTYATCASAPRAQSTPARAIAHAVTHNAHRLRASSPLPDMLLPRPAGHVRHVVSRASSRDTRLPARKITTNARRRRAEQTQSRCVVQRKPHDTCGG